MGTLTRVLEAVNWATITKRRRPAASEAEHSKADLAVLLRGLP